MASSPISILKPMIRKGSCHTCCSSYWRSSRVALQEQANYYQSIRRQINPGYCSRMLSILQLLLRKTARSRKELGKGHVQARSHQRLWPTHLLRDLLRSANRFPLTTSWVPTTKPPSNCQSKPGVRLKSANPEANSPTLTSLLSRSPFLPMANQTFRMGVQMSHPQEPANIPNLPRYQRD